MRTVLATKKPGEYLGKGEKMSVVGAKDPEGSQTRIYKHSERYIVVSGCFQLLLTKPCQIWVKLGRTGLAYVWEKLAPRGRLQARPDPEFRGHSNNLTSAPFHSSPEGSVILNPPAWLQGNLP